MIHLVFALLGFIVFMLVDFMAGRDVARTKAANARLAELNAARTPNTETPLTGERRGS